MPVATVPAVASFHVAGKTRVETEPAAVPFATVAADASWRKSATAFPVVGRVAVTLIAYVLLVAAYVAVTAASSNSWATVAPRVEIAY